MDGYFFPIVEERMKYTHSLRLGDTFTIKLHLDEFENRLVHSFEIECHDQICVKGRTVQVALPKNGQELSFFMPPNFVKAIKKLDLSDPLGSKAEVARAHADLASGSKE